MYVKVWVRIPLRPLHKITGVCCNGSTKKEKQRELIEIQSANTFKHNGPKVA
jgi:hypothetical protein